MGMTDRRLWRDNEQVINYVSRIAIAMVLKSQK